MATWATLPGSRAGARGSGSFWLRVARLIGAGQRRPYVLFVLPAMAIIAAVIIFPWFFTLFMSVHDWKITQGRSFVGLENYANLLGDERFQWALLRTLYYTLLVMLIVLGGLAALPTEPYEAAQLDGASAWQTFWRITFPMVLPFLMVAAIIRTIDAVKAFDIIFVISQGGPGTASETLNIFLYLQAFAFYNIGYASAMVVVFFALIIALSLVLLYVRQRSKWS